MNQKLYFLPLGGCAEIGMNLNLYSYDDQWLMVDLGITFHDGLGFDVITPDPQYIVERKKKLLGLVLTHGHEDHIGAVPYLWNKLKCPIYATAFTAEMVRQKLHEVGIDDAPIYEVPLGGGLTLGPFDIQLVGLTHSIPEAQGVFIKTPAGSIFHTGDWKLDPNPLVGKTTDEETLKKIGDEGVLALVCDSTNVFQEEHSGSEEDAFNGMSEVIAHYPGKRILVTCFASNVARLHSAATIAQKLGRKVVLAGRSFRRIEKIARTQGYLKNIFPFLSPSEASKLDPSQVLYISTGSQGENRSMLRKLADGEGEIVLESGDVVIFSSRVIPGNEKRIGSLKNALTRRGLHIITHSPSSLHVSGHPSRQELRQMYEWIRPQIAIPVHGELRHLVEHGRLAKKCGVKNIIIAENGSLISLSKEDSFIQDTVTNGHLAVDGAALIPTNHPCLKERVKLSCNGTVFVSVVFDEELELSQEPLISFKGLFNLDNAFGHIKSGIIDLLEDMRPKERFNTTAVEERIKSTVLRLSGRFLDKRPIVSVHIMYV